MPYVDEFVKSIASLPSELNENYSEIRKLDIHLQEHEKLLEELYERELKDAKAAIECDGMVGKSSYSRKATDATEVCRAIAEQKIKLAIQTYKRVDGHIRRLDKYLKKFDHERRRDSEARAGTAALELKSDASGAHGKDSDFDKRSQVVEQPVTMDIDLPIDPNEPTYCICNRVSFGDMIACDNENCRTEWFHYECVGIVDQPKGKWYCHDCARKMKHRKKKLA